MNKPLILVVEDDPSVRNLITTTLKTNDYRYVVAPNGSAAIMEATSHNPEIILLDLGLPDMDGVQVIQTVRSWSNVPIIVISARSEDNDKIKALDAGDKALFGRRTAGTTSGDAAKTLSDDGRDVYCQFCICEW